MSKFSAADVPVIARDVIVRAIDVGDYEVAVMVTVLADLQREYPEILLDGSSRQLQTWLKYRPEILVSLTTDSEQYETVAYEVYKEHLEKSVEQSIQNFVDSHFPGAEIEQWGVLVNGELVAGSAPQSQVTLTDLPEPAGQAVDALADREEGDFEPEKTSEQLPKEFDLEAQADNVVTLPTVTEETTPAQPKWGC